MGRVWENGGDLLHVASQGLGLLISLAVLGFALADGVVGLAIGAGVSVVVFAGLVAGLQLTRRGFGADVDQLLAAVERALGRRP